MVPPPRPVGKSSSSMRSKAAISSVSSVSSVSPYSICATPRAEPNQQSPQRYRAVFVATSHWDYSFYHFVVEVRVRVGMGVPRPLLLPPSSFILHPFIFSSFHCRFCLNSQFSFRSLHTHNIYIYSCIYIYCRSCHAWSELFHFYSEIPA
jgi:hypothetical protein